LSVDRDGKLRAVLLQQVGDLFPVFFRMNRDRDEAAAAILRLDRFELGQLCHGCRRFGRPEIQKYDLSPQVVDR